MFGECYRLTSLDISNFNTLNVTSMGGMFSGCTSLTSLNLSNFNTSNVIDMGGMFSGCTSLTSLNLSNFDMSNLGYYDPEENWQKGKVDMCFGLSITSSNCTLTCPLTVENAIKEVDPDYNPSNPEWPHPYYYFTGFPTTGVTFTWVRPSSSK